MTVLEVKMNRNIFKGKLNFLFVSLLLFAVTNVLAIDYSQSNVIVSNSGTMTLKLNSANPQISTTRNGDTVIISGQGFDKYEIVSLSVESYSELLDQTTILTQWNLYADAKGGFETTLPTNLLVSTSGRFVFKAFGNNNKSYTESYLNTALLPPSGDLDQCANGPFSSPQPCTGSNWQNGNVGQSQGHYYEGDSIPYRIKFEDIPTSGSNTVQIEWDTTQGGKHAIDYITSYDHAESVGNNPCSGVVPACGAATTFPIPLDPNVSGAGVTQIPGQVFTMWGGTITSVSSYTLSGSYLGNSSTRITITFTASQSNPVLAWGGHIADRNDWALMGGSASDINGSPYHTRLLGVNGSGGNQDRSLSNVAVRLNSKIIIIAHASPEGNQAFPFTTTNLLTSGANLIPSAFTLFDDGVDNDATPNNITFDNLLAPNASGTFSATEDVNIGFYQLMNITCTVASGGTSTTSVSVPLRTADVNLNYGDTVTCEFFNAVPTAASSSVSGRVTDSVGNGLSRVRVAIQNLETGEIRTVSTNSFGNYQIDDLLVGDVYRISVSHRKYTFENNDQIFTLDGAIEDLNFSAIP
jgi:hypothetical protein